jgi:hypothetical protein
MVRASRLALRVMLADRAAPLRDAVLRMASPQAPNTDELEVYPRWLDRPVTNPRTRR